MPRIIVLVICLTLISACTLPGATNISRVTSTPLVSSTETPGSLHEALPSTETPSTVTFTPPGESMTSVQDTPVLTHYILQAELDYWGHTLSVSETIEYTNNSLEIFEELQLEVEANRWEGGFNIQSLEWASGESVKEYELTNNQLKIPLSQPLQPGEKLTLFIDYQLTLPPIPEPSDTARPVPFGYTKRQINLVDWYLSIPPYRSGEGWLLHRPGYFGEHQVYEMADFDVQIRLSQSVKDLVVAASAPADQTGDSYQYHLESARNFVWSASHVYQVNSIVVENVMVISYFFPTDRWASEQALQDTAKALALYSGLFMPYPYASLSVVEADFLDGMEFSGLYFLSRGFYNLYDGTAKGYLTAIAAHETAHQWFYNLVGNDQALEPWLDEALCTYSERIFYENSYPDLLSWWWAFRVDYYEPSGMINGAIYDYGSFRSYRDSVYLHGAQFLEDLRLLVGDETFFAFLRDYVISQTGLQTTSLDFFRILQTHTTKDLDALRNQYFAAKEE